MYKNIVEVNKETVRKIEEDNKKAIISYVKEIVANIVGGTVVNEEKVSKIVEGWFGAHKHCVENFSFELLAFGDEVVKMVVNNRDDWIT